MQADIYFKRFYTDDLSDEQHAELKKFDKYFVDDYQYYHVDAYTLHLMCIACSFNQTTRKELFEAWTKALLADAEHNFELRS